VAFPTASSLLLSMKSVESPPTEISPKYIS
jgi:hypothetical protein